jgi:hypothetical protein
MRCIKPLGILSALAFSATLAHAGAVKTDDETVYRPTGKGHGELDDSPGAVGHARAAAKGGGSNGINYNGGPVMLGTPAIYFIWYGNWAGNTAPAVLNNFAQSIGGSPYFNINKTYYSGSGAKSYVSGTTVQGASTSVTYPYGTSLTDANIKSVVMDAINSNALPSDTNGVYFVLTSSDVTASSGFCTQYCGWHTHANIVGHGDIKYSFVGNPDRCPTSCAEQTTSPNSNAGADGMASIIAHELEEAVTDPDLNAWYDRRGYENADKCAWTFGTTNAASNGSKYNMTLGVFQYLIQQNWVNASGGYCALQ